VNQGCQMVYFQTKNPIFVSFGVSCNEKCSLILRPFSLIYCYLVYFMAFWYILKSFWYILWQFGIFCGHFGIFCGHFGIFWGHFGTFCCHFGIFSIFLSRFGMLYQENSGKLYKKYTYGCFTRVLHVSSFFRLLE
jgi:hypothetical protein